MSKINKLLGEYLCEIGNKLMDKEETICPMLMSDLLTVLSKIDEKPKLEKENKESLMDNIIKDIKSKRDEDHSPSKGIMDFLGIGEDLFKVGEHISMDKPSVKIKVKKVSSSDNLDKILKELKEGGLFDLNTANNALGEYFDLNTILLILESPMFKEGGSLNTLEEVTLEEFLKD